MITRCSRFPDCWKVKTLTGAHPVVLLYAVLDFSVDLASWTGTQANGVLVGTSTYDPGIVTVATPTSSMAEEAIAYFVRDIQ